MQVYLGMFESWFIRMGTNEDQQRTPNLSKCSKAIYLIFFWLGNYEGDGHQNCADFISVSSVHPTIASK